jgi:hypothetical protein
MVWIIAGVVVLALAGFAFWPRRRGVVDSEVRQERRRDQGRIVPYDHPDVDNMGF